MFSAIALVLASQSGGLTLPAGCMSDFQNRALAVEAAAKIGDFAAANAGLKLLPKRGAAITWDDSKVSSDLKASFAGARDLALADWNNSVPGLGVHLGEGRELHFSFDPNPPIKDRMPVKVHLDPPEPSGQIDVHIALEAGSPRMDMRPTDVRNAVSLALARYLGVADPMVPGSAANANDTITPMPTLVRGFAAQTAANNLAFVEDLTGRVLAHARTEPLRSRLVLSTSTVAFDPTLQGTPGSKNFTVTNSGDGPLNLMWIRTCGCMSLDGPSHIAPGQSASVNVTMDTSVFMGGIDKHIILLSNDPVTPNRLIDLHIDVQPRYRFLTPGGDVTSIDSKGGRAVFYLVFANRNPFRIKQMDLNGFAGAVDYEPWSGTLPDPDLGEGPAPRTGFKFTVTIPGNIPAGRFPASLNLITDDPKFSLVTFTFYAQKGIIAIPEELFMGDGSQGPYSVLLSRPTKTFHVVSARTDNRALSVKVRVTKAGEEYALDVAYDGHAPSGELKANIIVATDDPSQPAMKIPVVASVK